MTATQDMPLFMEVGRVIKPAPITDLDGNAIDISGAVEKSVQVTRVTSGASTEWSADFSTLGTDGQLEHVTEAGELDEVGRWRVWAFVRLADGRELYSPERTFQVHETSDGGTGVGSGTTTHATRHHHDGDDPLLVDDLGASGGHSEATFFVTGPAGVGLTEGEITAAAVSVVAGVLDPHLDEELAPEYLSGSSTGTDTVQASYHWMLRRKGTAGTAVITVPDDLPGGMIVFYKVEGVEAAIRFADGGVNSLEGDGLTIHDGEIAVLVTRVGRNKVARLGPPRLDTGTTLTADHTVVRRDHGKVYSVDAATPVTITVPDDLPAETEVVFDVVGASATFAASGTQVLVGPGLTAPTGSTVRLIVRSATRAKLIGSELV